MTILNPSTGIYPWLCSFLLQTFGVAIPLNLFNGRAVNVVKGIHDTLVTTTQDLELRTVDNNKNEVWRLYVY